MLKTPVVLIIFNRPGPTAQVFAEIARARPSRLFVVADGPRDDHPEDKKLCAEARAVVDQVEWPCEVVKNYAETNLGCGRRPASGITWVFEQVEEAIILEDDCIPDPSFFPFVEELLRRYRVDDRVMMISGRCELEDQIACDDSYYFSRIPNCWGWATWRRVWQLYDQQITRWSQLRNTDWLADVLKHERAAAGFGKELDHVFDEHGTRDIWDYQFSFTCWLHQGLAIVPCTNLVQNCGFGETATHTKSESSRMRIESSAMSFPLRHPSEVHQYEAADRLFCDRLFPGPTRRSRLYRQIRKRITAVKRLLVHPRTANQAS